MGSTMAVRTMPATAVAAEEAEHGNWQIAPLIAEAAPAPSRLDSMSTDQLGPARGIGLAVLAGIFIWAGLGWSAATVVTRFF